MATFHPFARLPTELREQIWKDAIRPTEPGAQFFTIYNTADTDEISAAGQHAVTSSTSSNPGYLSMASPWAAPRCDKSTSELSWTASNPSTYMLDRGLWSACRESWQIMENHYQWKKCRQKLVDCADINDLGGIRRPDDPTTVAMMSNGERQYFTMFERTDLLCLQPLNNGVTRWEILCSELPSHTLAVFGLFVGGYDIAVELDPSWHEDYKDADVGLGTYYRSIGYNDKTSLGDFIRAVDAQDEYSDQLWIIDYRINRKPEIPLTTDARAEWKLSDGRKLVQVGVNDLDGWTGSNETWGLLDLIQEIIWDHHHETELEPDLFDHHRPLVGVLACIDDADC